MKQRALPDPHPRPRDFTALVIPGATCSASLSPPARHSSSLLGAVTWPLSSKFKHHSTTGFLQFPSVPVPFDSRIVNPIFFFLIFIYLLTYGCVGSSFLCEGSLRSWQAGATPHRSARASHHRGLSRCGAQAPDAQAQQLWLAGPVAPRHVGSSQTRARTRVPCIGRQILNHSATREAQSNIFNGGEVLF